MYTCCKLQTDKQKKNHIKSTHKSYILFSLSGVGGGEGGWGVEGKVGGRLVHQSKNGLNWLCFKNYTWAHCSIHHAAFSMGEY